MTSHPSTDHPTDQPPKSPSVLRIECVFGQGYRSVESVQVQVDFGSSVLDALIQALKAGLSLQVQDQVLDAQSTQDFDAFQGRLQTLLSQSQLFLSLWGEPCALDQVFSESTRLEITKALRVDPKVARRERFKKQGAKAAGLFAKQRAGAKAGY